jgi:Tfp pilus assembly protein PilO
MDKLKEILERIPVGMLVALYVGYLGYDAYTFVNASDSPLGQKSAELQTVQKENGDLQVKIKKANDFFKSLDAKKAELRTLAQTLDDLKTTLSTETDVPGFMKMAVTEAKRVGLAVMGIKPLAEVEREYYKEQPFELEFRGVYVQLLVFLDRLSNVQNIVRVDDFDIKPIGLSTSRFVELDGVVKIKTYKYVGTKADAIGRPGDTKPNPASSPVQGAGTPAKSGGGP